MTLMMKNAISETESPIMAYVILDRAAATFALSPPDVIHPIPPRIRYISVRRTATISMMVIVFPITFEVTFSPPCGIPPGAVIVFPPGSVNAR